MDDGGWRSARHTSAGLSRLQDRVVGKRVSTSAASTPHRGYGAQRVVTCRLDRGVPGSRLKEFRSHSGWRRSVSSRRILTSLAEQGTQQARDFRIDHRRLPKIFAATNRKAKLLRTLATSLMLIGQPASQDRGAAAKAFAVSRHRRWLRWCVASRVGTENSLPS